MKEVIEGKLLKIIVYITAIGLGLFLNNGTARAQAGGEIKFNVSESHLTTNKNWVTVSTAINAKQSISRNGIHFALIVKNN